MLWRAAGLLSLGSEACLHPAKCNQLQLTTRPSLFPIPPVCLQPAGARSDRGRGRLGDADAG